MRLPTTGTSERRRFADVGGLLLGLLILLTHAPIAQAQTKTWFGGYGALWSDPANWVGGVAPVDGDSLEFPYEGTWSHNMWNDIPGLTVGSVTSANDFRVGGDTVTLTGNLTFGTWNVPTILGADVSMKASVTKAIELAGHSLTLDGGLEGPIQGAGAVTVSSGLIVGETSVSTFAGTLSVAPGAGLTVYGTISVAAVVVGAGGALGGSGTIGTTTLTEATLAGGSTFLGGAPFTTGDLLVQGGKMPYQFWLSPSIQAQTELAVLGTVALASPVLEVSLPWNPPTVGQQFVLIDNDG